MTRRPIIIGRMSFPDRVAELLAGPRPLPLVHAGDPVLRRTAERYDGQLPAAQLAELLAAMRETMHAAPGVGLAAPQIGLGLAIAVLEDQFAVPPAIAHARRREPVPFRVLVNPAYTAVGTDLQTFYEGCLSVPGYQAVVSRATTVRLRGQDETGAALDEEVSGWAARIVAHETDHLSGTLYLDRAALRSLTTNENYTRHWAAPAPDAARAALGF